MGIFQDSGSYSWPPKIWQKWLTAGLTALAINLGVGLMGGQTSPLPLTALAMAQDQAVTDSQVSSYALAVLRMDPPRTEAYTRIKNLLMEADYDMSQVDMSCTSPQNTNSLPRNIRASVREILANYCNQARDIVERNGLTVRQFNDITQAHQNDPALAERIRMALIELQQEQQTDGNEPTEP